MFGQPYTSGNRKFSLYITITCKEKKNFRIWAEDYGKRNSKYADRDICVEPGKRTIHFSFPISPKELFIGAANSDNPYDKDFEILLIEGPLKSYNIYLDGEVNRFLDICIPFCQVCGFEDGTQSGRMFPKEWEQSEFKIKFFDIIRDRLTGKVMNTPARIGHSTGIIEVAKARFDSYTVAMRMIILLHEFSHKYRNPKIGLEISNETGADINALYIYLGLGFSKVDAICVFANVFLRAQTTGNMNRMRKIYEYIQKFENQEYAQLN